MQYITSEGLEKIKKDLTELKSRRQEIAERLEEAKALGDLSENAEYSSAKEAQAFNEGKILELEAVIKDSVLIDPEKQKNLNGSQIVQIGSVLEVNSDKNPTGQKFYIVSPQEADPFQGKISNESPLGKAFLGHKKGDIIEVETPGGKVNYKINNIN